MKLAVTIDVEEEGLFQGSYDRFDCKVTNVPALYKLDPIFAEFGIRPTLLLTYQVVRSAPSHEMIYDLRDRWNAEIGAHLHHWNTPPFLELPYPDPVPSDLIPHDILASKVDNLLTAFDGIGVIPVSFRMGRFDIGCNMLSVLAKTTIRVDSSIAPMRREYGGPDHLAAPIEPYFPDPLNVSLPGDSDILEAPITVVPVIPHLGISLERIRTQSSFMESTISWLGSHLFSIPVQPMWTGLRRMKAGVLIHRSRGGKVLTLFFHSSELMPGGSPKNPSTHHVEGFLKKLREFLLWLYKTDSVESITLSELRSSSK